MMVMYWARTHESGVGVVAIEDERLAGTGDVVPVAWPDTAPDGRFGGIGFNMSGATFSMVSRTCADRSFPHKNEEDTRMLNILLYACSTGPCPSNMRSIVRGTQTHIL